MNKRHKLEFSEKLTFSSFVHPVVNVGCVLVRCLNLREPFVTNWLLFWPTRATRSVRNNSELAKAIIPRLLMLSPVLPTRGAIP